MASRVVVAGALVLDGALLVAQRRRPPELAGLWELPGGKVAPGEDEADALARELREELGIEVRVGTRLRAEAELGEDLVLRAYRVTRIGGEMHPHDHTALRWVDGPGLDDLPWVPADRIWIPELRFMILES